MEYEISDALAGIEGVKVNGTEMTPDAQGKVDITDAVLADVKYTTQSLTDNQKTQARTNIGATTLVEYTGTETSYADNTLYYVVE